MSDYIKQLEERVEKLQNTVEKLTSSFEVCVSKFIDTTPDVVDIIKVYAKFRGLPDTSESAWQMVATTVNHALIAKARLVQDSTWIITSKVGIEETFIGGEDKVVEYILEKFCLKDADRMDEPVQETINKKMDTIQTQSYLEDFIKKGVFSSWNLTPPQAGNPLPNNPAQPLPPAYTPNPYKMPNLGVSSRGLGTPHISDNGNA